jgi:Ferredoxin subunits of nitrite reductase and ring-hydroxylating dioxygenases
MADDAWIPVMALEDLPDSKARRADLDGVAVLLYRAGERLFAIGNRCTHQGAPLDRGPVRVGGSEATVTCPAHGSVFRLTDGAVVRAPAHDPVPAFEVRVLEGRIELRAKT